MNINDVNNHFIVISSFILQQYPCYKEFQIQKCYSCHVVCPFFENQNFQESFKIKIHLIFIHFIQKTHESRT
jgi:hypothetical protein